MWSTFMEHSTDLVDCFFLSQIVKAKVNIFIDKENI